MPTQIQISRGYSVTVDDEDVSFVTQWKWTALPTKWTVYARRNKTSEGKQHSVYLHRELMNRPPGLTVDHIDRNGLNCTRANMRLATPSENQRNKGLRSTNTSGVIGVSWSKISRKWQAIIGIHYKQIHLGFFDDIVDAAKAYREASEKHHGEFATHLSRPTQAIPDAEPR